MDITVISKPNRNIKGLRGTLQKKLHAMGIYGLELWFDYAEGKEYHFTVLSPYGPIYVAQMLDKARELIND